MAKLAIKGHPTRGSEVIALLEMLGGINKYNLRGNEDEWYVLNGKQIQRSDRLFTEKGFTLEEFLEKFPYKVGDRVSSKYLKNYKIEKMEWEGTNNRVIYKLQGGGWYSVNELQPYKKETMETITIDDFKANTKEWLIDKLHGMIISDAIKTIGNIHDELHKPQYPKTYEKCCEVLGIDTQFCMKYLPHGTFSYKETIIYNLQELLICRDAYWKITGEKNKSNIDYVTCNVGGKVINTNIPNSAYNHILTFPTEEIRDAFYENFKELIETCKELL